MADEDNPTVRQFCKMPKKYLIDVTLRYCRAKKLRMLTLISKQHGVAYCTSQTHASIDNKRSSPLTVYIFQFTII